MEVRHLELLRELADRGSVTAVAHATHRTPSAVSQQLRSAQREAGMLLVEPDGRGLKLTEAGLLLAEGGAELQTALAAVQSRWDAYRNDAGGSVSVLAFPSAAGLLFPHLLVAAEAAGIDLVLSDVDPAEGEFAPLTRDFDVVISHSLNSPQPTGSATLATHRLMEEPLDVAMAAAHPLAAKSELRVEDLLGSSWIGVPEGYPFNTVLNAIADALGQPLNVMQRVRDNRLCESLVTGSRHLAILPRFSTTSRSDLDLRPLTGLPATRWVTALMRPDRAQRRVVRWALKAMDDVVRGLSD